MQKFWKSVKIWQSYREFKGGNFFLKHVIVAIISHQPSRSGWLCTLACLCVLILCKLDISNTDPYRVDAYYLDEDHPRWSLFPGSGASWSQRTGSKSTSLEVDVFV